jgi:mitogen-activated protein kinase kinase
MTLAQNRFPYPDDLIGIIELINYITKEDIPQLTDEDADQDGYAEVRWSDNMKQFISIWSVSSLPDYSLSHPFYLCSLTRDEAHRPKPSKMLDHPWLTESSQRKVNMAQWIREVWGWEKRGRPATNNSGTSAQSGERRPSAVRSGTGERTSSMTRA